MVDRSSSLPLTFFYLGSWLCFLAQVYGVAAVNQDRRDIARPIATEDTGVLHRLTNPPNPCVDIIAVHGLDGHWKKSWTATNGVFWLEDLLPSEIPCARVYSFSHDSRTRGSDTPLTLDISDHGKALIAELYMARQSTKTDRVPILFLGHSLGGVIIKSALLDSDLARVGHLERYKSIKLSTYAVLFLGTPHQGGEGISMVEIVRKISSTVSYTNKKILDKLVRNSEWLLELQSRYNAISQDFETICFYETLKMALPIGKLLIVPKHSAIVFGAANSEAVPMVADHSTIVKFGTSSNDGFQKIVKRLQLFTRNAKEKIDDNWMRWQFHKGYPRLQDYQQLPDKEQRPESNEKEFNLGITFKIMRNPHFTGREDMIQNLADILNRHSDGNRLTLAVLYGAGGMGKTQIAIEYVHRFMSEYTAVFWIDGSRNYTAAASILTAVKGLKWHYEINDLRKKPWFGHIQETLRKRSDAQRATGIPRNDDTEIPLASLSEKGDDTLREMFLRWLSVPENCSWLMVIDNVDDLESFDFLDWLPSTLCGSLIITSRRRDLATYWKSVEVDRMTEDEAIQLLKASSGVILNHGTNEWNSSIHLIEELGHLPLAISQAGAYISMSHEHEPVGQYLTRYQKYPKELLANKATKIPWDSKKESVLTTWEISYTAIRDRNPLAARLLLLCGFLERNLITEDLFESQNSTDFEINQALRILVSYSLFRESASPGGQVYLIHPLIHRWIRYRMDNDEKKFMARQTAMLLRSHRGDVNELHFDQFLAIYHDLYPCSSGTWLDSNVVPCPSKPTLAEVRQHLQGLSVAEGWALRLRGWVDEIQSYLYHRYLNDGDSSLSEWELLYSLRSKSQRITPYIINLAICRARRTFPTKHPRILEMVGNYANSFLICGSAPNHMQHARAWYWWLVLTRTQVLGPGHPATAGAYLGLGRSSNDCEVSLVLMGAACDIRIASLGSDDYLSQNALHYFAEEATRCGTNAVERDDVFKQVGNLVQAQGEEKTKQMYPDLFASYNLRAKTEAASRSTISDWKSLLTVLESFFDMVPRLRWETCLRMASALLNITEQHRNSAISHVSEGHDYLLPYVIGLRYLLDEYGVTLLLPPVDSVSYNLNSRWNYDWPADSGNWRLLLPLVRALDFESPVWKCISTRTFLLNHSFERDPLNQLWVFKWFEPLGPILIEIKLFFDSCARRWAITYCSHLNDPGPIDRFDYTSSRTRCTDHLYICEDRFCEDLLMVRLILLGRLGIDKKSNLLDLRLVQRYQTKTIN